MTGQKLSICVRVCARAKTTMVIRNSCHLVEMCVIVNRRSDYILNTLPWPLTLTAICPRCMD